MVATRRIRALTHRQKDLYDFICDFNSRHKLSPTLAEMALHLGIRKTCGVYCHLRALQKKGYITFDKHKHRSVRLIHTGEAITRITAGDVAVFSALETLIRERNQIPMFSELAEFTDITPVTLMRHLNNLRGEGWIDWEVDRPRSFVIRVESPFNERSNSPTHNSTTEWHQ